MKVFQKYVMNAMKALPLQFVIRESQVQILLVAPEKNNKHPPA